MMSFPSVTTLLEAFRQRELPTKPMLEATRRAMYDAFDALMADAPRRRASRGRLPPFPDGIPRMRHQVLRQHRHRK